MEASMTKKRNRRKQIVSFEERLRQAAREAREAATRLDGTARDVMLQKARQAETALRINGWLALPRGSTRQMRVPPETNAAT
jgi:hypothetical protein